MQKRLHSKIASWIINGLEKVTKGKYWTISATIIIAITCWVYFFPKYYVATTFLKPRYDTASVERRVMKTQIKKPFTALPDYGAAHPGKMQFRLTVPAIGYLFHLNYRQLLYLQYILGVLFFWVLILLAIRCTSDKVAAVLAALGFAFTYVGINFFTDSVPYYDGFAFFFLACAMMYRSPVLVFSFVTLCCWTDERALIASALVIVWWQTITSEGDFSVRRFFQFARPSLAVVCAWGVYFITRYLLMSHYGLRMSTQDLFSLEEWNKHPMQTVAGIFAGLRFFWVVVVLGFAWLVQHKKYFLALVLFAISSALVLSSAMVKDHLRSIAYLYPIIIIFLYVLGQYPEKKSSIRHVLLAVALLCFAMTPLEYFFGLDAYN